MIDGFDGYDQWKLRCPEDEMSPMDEARAEIERLQKDVEMLSALLDRCASHLEVTDDPRPVLLEKIYKALETI